MTAPRYLLSAVHPSGATVHAVATGPLAVSATWSRWLSLGFVALLRVRVG